MNYGLTLEALANPTRRRLFERLRHRPHTVGALAAFAKVRQPTVSQHLQVLERARLVRYRKEGTRRYFSASTEGLAALRQYVESLWDDVLEAYAADDPHPRGSRSGARKRGAR
jgi:DNA-binding transcriptional ArsR family regulator